MLNVKIPRHEEGGQFQVNFGGNVLELTSDVCIVLNSIFNNLKNGPVPAQAECFQLKVMQAVLDPTSAAWKSVPGDTHISMILPKG